MRRYHLIVIAILFGVLAFFGFGFVPAQASRVYGPPAAALSLGERIEYSARLVAHGDRLVTPLLPGGVEQPFLIEPGESVRSIATRLEGAGIISSSQAFQDYLVYTGLDLTLQSGEYKLSAGMSIVDIAKKLQDSTPEQVTLVILAGWRLEEIAASLPTSGLGISPEEFIAAARTPPQVLDFIPEMRTMEGFFLPDSYILPRSASVVQVLELIARNFNLHITEDLRLGFAGHGLDVYQAVILASIVERESIQEQEQALIASVFLNRLNAGMSLGSDPTVQYALGYNLIQNTWWTNPLSGEDLKIDSPYNTYMYPGLPPAPIASPGLKALQAVAFPEASSYYYFRAACNHTGSHNFAVTLEEHIANECP